MPRFALVAMIPLMMLGACRHSSSAEIASLGRINVTNEHGKATIWGVQFEVFETGRGGASIESPGTKATPANPEPEQTCRLGFGEVVVELARFKDGVVAMTIDGKDYGLVSTEAKIVVTADRKVTVNGDERPPT